MMRSLLFVLAAFTLAAPAYAQDEAADAAKPAATEAASQPDAAAPATAAEATSEPAPDTTKTSEATSHKPLEPKQIDWQFDGVFGTFDKPSIQRGMQVYKEVCATCHSLNHVAFRTLTGAGFSAAEVKSLAAGYTVHDGPNDSGDMFDRPGKPSDVFVPPYPNEEASRAANNGAYPPDLSLIVKAREDGANYVYSILTGFADAPADFPVPNGKHYNPYMPGRIIAMPPPLSKDNIVEYQDGTPATREQMAHDVVNFLEWTAEPEMETRKRMGIRVMIFLAAMTGFFYVAKKRIWSDIH